MSSTEANSGAERAAQRGATGGGLAGNVLFITIFSVASPFITFFIQIVTAAYFGASSLMDAFLAGITLPMYVVAVVLGSAVSVFIPLFIEKLAVDQEKAAWQLTASVLSFTLLATSALALAGIVFAEPLLRLTTPGLAGEAMRAAVSVTRITWLSVPASALTAFLTGIYQARGRFVWSSAVPVIGTAVNLVLLPFLIPMAGISGLAASAAIGVILQMLLLLPVLKGRISVFSFSFKDSGLREILRLAYPMVLFGILTKCTPIVERHLASGMEQGSISHLGYAFRLLSTSAFLISTGITTVAFPRMALQSALTNVKGLWKTISGSFRMMFLVVAPATTLGVALALPLVSALFERGKFTVTDSVAVCGLLRIYLLTLVATTLGNISCRAFYAIKDTRTLAVFGTLETVAYVLYTSAFASRFGVSGIAWGYVIYFCISFTWQTAILWFRFGRGERGALRPFGLTAVCALAAGLGAWFVKGFLPGAWFQLLGGISAGALVYLGALKLLKSDDLELFLKYTFRRHKAVSINRLGI
ncbi:MAG: lipid II flippase MurJ [Elusimicrobiales bacterium]|nr:lipid II flippase MurJ [Elusimicrobiales bacterium]